MFSILVHAAQPSAHVPHPSRNSCPKLHSSGDCGHSSRRSARSPQPEVLTPEVLAWPEDLTGQCRPKGRRFDQLGHLLLTARGPQTWPSSHGGE